MLVSYFVLPFKHFLASHLRAGTLPLWNPFAFMGTPFLAGLQTGVLYPPSLLLLLPFPLGFGIFLFFHYLVAASGTWLWLRDRKLGAVASGVGSLVYTLGGFLVSMLNVTSFLQTAAWTPWILWRWSRFLETDRGGHFSC